MAVFLFGRSAPFSVEGNFSENTWGEIIKACQLNKVPETWRVGDYKLMTINGVEYQIDIIGKNHDSYSDGSGVAPLTLQLHNCYATSYKMNDTYTNVGGWTDCAMRTTHLPTILAQMPVVVQEGIRKVNKLTSAGNLSSTINTTADGLFLLAEIEVFGVTTFAKAGEGTQYEYYKTPNRTVKIGKTSATDWHCRSPFGSDIYSFSGVNSSGGVRSENANIFRGVAPAFCF